MKHKTLWSNKGVDVIEDGTVIGYFPPDNVQSGDTDNVAKKRAKLAARAPLMRNVLSELSLLLDLKGGFEIEVNAINETLKGL